MNPQHAAVAAAQQAQKQFQDRYEVRLRSTPFPIEKITPSWATNALHAMRFASILGLGLSPAEWNKILECVDADPAQMRSISLFEFACISNNLQKRTPDELGLRLFEYGDLMAEADELVVLWQSITDKIRDEVENEVGEELQMRDAAERGKNGMQPVN